MEQEPDYLAQAAELVAAAARLREAAGKPENGSRAERRYVVRQADDIEAGAELMKRCVSADERERPGLLRQIRKFRERIDSRPIPGGL